MPPRAFLLSDVALFPLTALCVSGECACLSQRAIVDPSLSQGPRGTVLVHAAVRERERTFVVDAADGEEDAPGTVAAHGALRERERAEVLDATDTEKALGAAAVPARDREVADVDRLSRIDREDRARSVGVQRGVAAAGERQAVRDFEVAPAGARDRERCPVDQARACEDGRERVRLGRAVDHDEVSAPAWPAPTSARPATSAAATKS